MARVSFTYALKRFFPGIGTSDVSVFYQRGGPDVLRSMIGMTAGYSG